MHIRHSRLAITVIAGLSVLAACGGGGDSQDTDASDVVTVLENGMTPQEQIELRQGQLKKMGKAFKGISDQLKSGEPDIAAIQAAAASLPVESAGMEDWFPAGTGASSGVKTDALPGIWEHPEDFAEKVANFRTASDNLAAVANTGDVAAIGEAFAATGGTCKSCHQTYRADD